MHRVLSEREHIQQVATQEGLDIDVVFCEMQLQRMGIDQPSAIDPQILITHMQTFHTMFKAHFDPLGEDD